MGRKPALITICTGCQREDVGVVLDWSHRNGTDQIVGRYRIARHKIKYLSKDKSLPWCINSRNIVPNELVFSHTG